MAAAGLPDRRCLLVSLVRLPRVVRLVVVRLLDGLRLPGDRSRLLRPVVRLAEVRLPHGRRLPGPVVRLTGLRTGRTLQAHSGTGRYQSSAISSAGALDYAPLGSSSHQGNTPRYVDHERRHGCYPSRAHDCCRSSRAGLGGSQLFAVSGLAGGFRAIPSTWRCPITAHAGSTIRASPACDHARLAPGVRCDSPLGRSAGWHAYLANHGSELCAQSRLSQRPAQRRVTFFDPLAGHSMSAPAARSAGGSLRRESRRGLTGGASGPCGRLEDV